MQRSVAVLYDRTVNCTSWVYARVSVPLVRRQRQVCIYCYWQRIERSTYIQIYYGVIETWESILRISEAW